MRFEAGRRSKKILEDLNLRGSQARELHIQVKSGKSRLDAKVLKKVLRRFQALDENKEGVERRYLLIAEPGIVHSLHLQPETLARSLTPPMTRDLEKFRDKHFASMVRDNLSLLSRVWFVRGPTFQRVLEKNLFLCGRMHGYDCGTLLDRRRALTHRDSLGAKFKRAASSEGVVLSSESLKTLVEMPPKLLEIAAELGIKLPPDHPLNRLDDVLGWRVSNLGSSILRQLLIEVHRPPDFGASDIAHRLRDAAESAYFSAIGDDENPSIRQLLAIRRLLSLLYSELDTAPMVKNAEEGQSEALAICWLSLGVSVRRQGGLLFVDVRRPPSRLVSKIQVACTQLLRQQVEVIDDAILEDVIVKASLESAEPPWLSSLFLEEDESENSSITERQPSLKGLAQYVQSMANIAGQSPQAAELAVTELRRILDDCRKNGRLALMISVAEKLSSCLLEQGKAEDAMAVLLEVSEEQAFEAGSNLFYRFHQKQLASLEVGGLPWAFFKNLEALVAIRRGHLIEMSKVVKEIDPDVTALLMPDTDEFKLKARLTEIRGVLVHRSGREAQSQASNLLYRLPVEWREARLKVLLLLGHAAYWENDPVQMSAAWAVMERELPALRRSSSGSEYEALAVLQVNLQWLMAKDTDELTLAFRRWEELEDTLTDDGVWSSFQIVRSTLEFRRRLFRGDLEISRRAAVDHLSRTTGGRKALRNAHQYYSSGSWTSALEAVYTALDASLLENDWPLMEEARQLLTQLWLKDGRPIPAILSFVRAGAAGSEKTMIVELAERLDESVIDEVFAGLMEAKDGPSKHRAWSLLIAANELLTVEQREKLMSRGRETLTAGPIFQEDVFAQSALFELLSKLLRCPSSPEESVRLLNLFLARFRDSKDDSARTETLRQIRRGFWSSTGMHPASEAGLQFLEKLDAMVPELTRASDREVLFDIIYGLGLNAKDSKIASRARSILVNHGADAALAEWDARQSTPTAKDIDQALSTVLRRASERITRGLEEASLAVSASSLTDVSPFVEHLKGEQLEQLFIALTDAASDSETESGRRWDALQVLRNPAFQRLPNSLLDSARRLFFEVLEGNGPKNMFDIHREEMNQSVFTGMTFDPQHEGRVQKTVCEALGGFHAKSTPAELKHYFRALLVLTETTRKEPPFNAAQSLRTFFQCDGHSDRPELRALLVRLLSHPEDPVRACAVQAVGEMVYNEKDLSDTLKLLIEFAVPQSYSRFELRKGLAEFSRLSLRLGPEHRHRQFAEKLNAKFRHDRNPVVQRYADVRFWSTR